MEHIQTITRKYQQASWRTQRQWLGLILLCVVVIGMVAWMYLGVSNEAIATGTEIINLNSEIAANQRTNAHLRTTLAELNSVQTMQERAEELGFKPASLDDVVFVAVPGYSGRAEFRLGGEEELLPESIILPAYKETLVEWFAQRLQASKIHGEAQP